MQLSLRLSRFFSTSCPRCTSIDYIAVGTQNVFENSLHWLIQPCKCMLCGKHFFLPRWQAPAVEQA